MDQNKLNEFIGKCITEAGAVLHAALALIGEEYGLYQTLAAEGPLTSKELATRTDTNERYVREWLSAEAAGGYIDYDSKSQKFSMSEEQAFALADRNSPAYMPGAYQLLLATAKAKDEIASRFRSGKGFAWHEHDKDLFEGCERFFRPGYAVNLASSWIPALEGMDAKLKNQGRVADIGCGFGASTILMAKAYPNSKFFGFDYHSHSVESARKRATDAGVSSQIQFETAQAHNFPGSNYDLVCFFDSLHDMGDPVGIAKHVRKSLKKDGVWMIVEPFAHDELENNLNPVGRLYYGASTLICTPNSLSQDVGAALGAQAGEKRIREVITAAGFSHFRRTSETPFNLVFEARP